MRAERWREMGRGDWREVGREVGRQREGGKLGEKQMAMKRGRDGGLGKCWGN